MARGNNLPFPYGSTYFGGDSEAIETTQSASMEGREYDVEDRRYGTTRQLRLRVVRNKGTGRIAASRGTRYGATSDWITRKVRGYSSANGDLAYPADDRLTTSVAQNDLFYQVVKGPVRVLAGSVATGTTALTANDVVSFGANGLLVPGAAGRAALGRINETITAGVTNRYVEVFVGAGEADTE